MSVLQRSSSVPEVQKQIANSNNRCVCEICTCGKQQPIQADTAVPSLTSPSKQKQPIITITNPTIYPLKNLIN